MSRFQAQRRLGLFAMHDAAMFAAIVFGIVVLILQGCLLQPDNLLLFRAKLLLELGVVILCALAWLIVLAYRILVFILDLHGDVALMPEAAARIAASYIEGRKPAK